MPIEYHTDAFDGQTTQAPAINKFLEKQWRLPKFAPDLKWKYNRSYMDASGSGMAYALRWLGTQISVVDPVITRAFPSYVQSLVRGLIHIYRSPKAGFMQRQWNKAANAMDDSRAEDFLKNSLRAGTTSHRAFADWFRLGLYEAPANTVKIRTQGLSGPQINDARGIRFVADVPYDLVLFMGTGGAQEAPVRPPEDNVIARGLVKSGGSGVTLAPISEDRYISTANLRWFKVGLYVPDGAACLMMDQSTLNYYKRITGRAHGDYNANEDIYWHLSGWERALEAAKVPAWFLKKAAPYVAKKALGALTGVSTTSDAPSTTGLKSWRQEQHLKHDGAGDTEATFSTYANAMWNGTTSSFNRKSIVPPNYCFVKFNCLLYVRVVAMDLPDKPEFKAARFKEAREFPKQAARKA